MTLEVLVATISQDDFSLVKSMNISSNVIFANQNNMNKYEEYEFKGYKAKLISTSTKGVGKNRNIAILYSSADILLFADDDVCYNDGYKEAVIKAFEKWPKADAIAFGLDLTKNNKIVSKRRNKNGRVYLWNSLRFGTCVLAIRRTSLQKYNIKFSELYGGGSIYSSGEDSLFIVDLLRKGGKLYASEYVLGTCSTDESTWFTGYHEKFFYDKGAWIACAFPKCKNFLKYYFLLRFSKLTTISWKRRLKLLNQGMYGFNRSISYSEWMEKDM